MHVSILVVANCRLASWPALVNTKMEFSSLGVGYDIRRKFHHLDETGQVSRKSNEVFLSVRGKLSNSVMCVECKYRHCNYRIANIII